MRRFFPFLCVVTIVDMRIAGFLTGFSNSIVLAGLFAIVLCAGSIKLLVMRSR